MVTLPVCRYPQASQQPHSRSSVLDNWMHTDWLSLLLRHFTATATATYFVVAWPQCLSGIASNQQLLSERILEGLYIKRRLAHFRFLV